MHSLVRTRLGVLFVALLVFVGVATALRAALYVWMWDDVGASPATVATILGVGLLFDLAAFAYGAAPVVLYLTFAPDRWYRSRVHRWLSLGLWCVYVYGVVFVATSEVFFWDEFASRFNFVAVDYLVYTKEVVGNIRESYALPWILAGLLVPTAALVAVTRRSVVASLAAESRLSRRLLPGALLLACPFVAFAAVDDSLSRVSENRYENELSRDGPYGFFAAFRRNDLRWEDFYLTAPEDQVLARLRDEVGAPRAEGARDVARMVESEGPERRSNVVLICVESLSGWFLDHFAAPTDEHGLTPRLDALADRGLLFTRLYATGTRTVRGLEAISLSIAPTPGRSVVKRPDNEGLFTMGSVFRDHGYDTRFIYGGYGYFDNMNAFFSGNGFEVVDRTDLADDEKTFGNVWGVCDEDLFARTLRECDRSHQAGRPFFQFVMTTSNHRPYTYPDGRVDVPSGTSREGAVKYTDYAIGKFIDDASRQPWFDDTIFVVVADHCSRSRGNSDLPVDRYHIPMIVYAPKLVAPSRFDGVCSQIDVAPTLFGLLGFRYESRFLGHDVMRDPPGRALIGNYLHAGLLRGDDLVTLGPQRTAHCDNVRNPTRPRARPLDADLVQAALAYYQGTDLLLRTGAQADPDVSAAQPR